MKPSTIEFRETSNNTWVMRITADRRIEVNEDVDVTEAAKLVLASMQNLLTPQRTWVGLTDEEVNELVEQTEYEDYYGLVEATEAKLKEKNT